MLDLQVRPFEQPGVVAQQTVKQSSGAEDAGKRKMHGVQARTEAPPEQSFPAET